MKPRILKTSPRGDFTGLRGYGGVRTGLAELSETVSTQSYEDLRQAHVDGWAKRWQLSDVLIDGDDAAQQGIRFNLFQLFSTYYGEDKRLNLGPKGFTGEKYGGATYWDTEAFGVPFYHWRTRSNGELTGIPV